MHLSQQKRILPLSGALLAAFILRIGPVWAGEPESAQGESKTQPVAAKNAGQRKSPAPSTAEPVPPAAEPVPPAEEPVPAAGNKGERRAPTAKGNVQTDGSAAQIASTDAETASQDIPEGSEEQQGAEGPEELDEPQDLWKSSELPPAPLRPYDEEPTPDFEPDVLRRAPQAVEPVEPEVGGTPSEGQASLPRIAWEPHYREFSVFEGILSFTFGVGGVVFRILGPPEDGPQGGIGPDEGVRDALRASSYKSRLLAADISDALFGIGASYALFGDPLVNAAWLRDSPKVGAQIALMNMEVGALTLGIQQFTSNAIGRERPYGRTCGTDELSENTIHCEGSDRYRSHFSGHTSMTFAMAAATCTHHLFLPLSGGHAWIPCTTGFAVSTATGVLRIVSDNHYLTDVIVGAVTGTMIGVAVPVFHYATGVKPLSGNAAGVDFQIIPTVGGAMVRGAW